MSRLKNKIDSYKDRAKAFSSDMKDVGQNTSETAKSALNAIKQTSKLPWKQMPLEGWFYIGFSAVALILIMLFL